MVIMNYKKVAMYVCIAIALLGFSNYNAKQARETAIQQQQEAQRIEEARIEKDYNDGLWYVSKGNFKDAKDKLNRFYDGKFNGNEPYKDAQVLAVYAKAGYYENETGVPYRLRYEYASRELGYIPDNYSGLYASEILSFKNKVSDRLDTYAKTDKARIAEREANITIGDSDYKVRKVYGDPKKINKTVVGNTVREQWVYNGLYIYLNNGVVTGWQE